jgi:hypothetical protein
MVSLWHRYRAVRLTWAISGAFTLGVVALGIYATSRGTVAPSRPVLVLGALPVTLFVVTQIEAVRMMAHSTVPGPPWWATLVAWSRQIFWIIWCLGSVLFLVTLWWIILVP